MQKLKTGKSLIRYFSIPCKATKANGARTCNLPMHDPEKWELYIEYNKQDVEAERAIRKRLLKFDIAGREQELWVHDRHINDRGVCVDLRLAQNAVKIDLVTKDRLFQEAKSLTGLENPKSTAQLKAWIKETAGYEADSLVKAKIPDVRKAANNKSVDKMPDIREQLAKTSTEKYNAMLGTACRDGRIRGLTQFYGARRIGRWAGRLVQMQNLPQNKMLDSDLDIARQLVDNGDMESLSMLYEDVSGTLSQLIRTAFIPKPGAYFHCFRL